MILKRFSAFAVGMLFCVHLTQATTSKNTDEPSKLNATSDIQPREDSTHRRNPEAQDPSWYLAPQNIKKQLDTLQRVVPLSYNSYVQSYIDAYTASRYKNHLAKMLELAQYYFPIYEKVFAETDVPQEIKYLSIIESALNPHAVSRVGATGPWQFMFATAKAFNLNIDNYVDERKDPYAATYAAAAYLKDAYNEFGDWQLAIASYNCGKGNVARAIQRSGIEKPDFWTVRKYLPQETRNYVPAFIAMTYVLSNYELLGISGPANAGSTLAAEEGTDVILIDKFIPLSGIAEALRLDLDQLITLNPAYKKSIINGTPEAPKRLVVPAVDKTSYASLYAALNTPTDAPAKVITASNTDRKAIYHRVRKGESLASVANKYQVEVQDLKVWNRLRRNAIVPGQRLKISEPGYVTGKKGLERKSVNYVTYKVRRGDTLSGIAQKYRGATVNNIKAMNNLKGSSLKPGMTLKINSL
ncbi:LysM peptidoglycan-binding domain-containing protein [Olivibacter sp. CPCC 100613]|uniref:lytic transglycosylase domain-containing protein n=1 Tax=Olivibacter sp. CPCC 100613 TaxID=3079931 RepID=UPI002FF8D86D